MVSTDIIYENLRYYKTRVLRTEDVGEKETLLAAIKRSEDKLND